jgi:hypothetical protein
MAARIHKSFKVVSFNANDIARQRYELSKQLQELHIPSGPALRDTFQTSWKFIYSKLHTYQNDRFPGRKVGTAVAARKGIHHNNIDLPSLVSGFAKRLL